MSKNTKHIAMGVAAVLMLWLAFVAIQENLMDAAMPACLSAIGFVTLIVCEHKGWI